MEITRKEKQKIGKILYRRTKWNPIRLEELIQEYLGGNNLLLNIELLEAIRGEEDDVYYFGMKKPQLVTQLRLIHRELSQPFPKSN